MKILIALNILFLIVGIFLYPRISIRGDGVTISLPRATFYIPAYFPTKIYKFNPFPPELNQIIETNTKDYPAKFGIYIKNISTGQQVTLNADENFNAASLYKLAVMYTIFKKGNEGKLDLTNEQIKNNLNTMITVSSNKAAYFLVDNYTSWGEVTQMMKELGLKNTSLNISPIITTPFDVAKLLELIVQGKAVNIEASAAMLQLMAEQKINDRIPLHLPPNAIVAHKTGELNDARHDAGVIISPENNFILVLMSKDSSDPEKVKPIMAKISSDVYEFFSRQWTNPPEIL